MTEGVEKRSLFENITFVFLLVYMNPIIFLPLRFFDPDFNFIFGFFKKSGKRVRQLKNDR